MKVAIIHDWLTVYAGAEKALEQILVCFPSADLFTMVDFLPSGDREFLLNRKITTSFIQRLPFAKKFYRNYLPLMPYAVEQFDLSSYDIIISSSHAVAKGVITGPDQIHISYVHSPMRYAWDLQFHYLKESDLTNGLSSIITRYLLHRLRKWDALSANRVDVFLTNSSFVQRRIQKCYRRKSTVIFGPVAVQDFTLCDIKDDFYLAASRMVPYKKMDLIVNAFALMPDKKLVVIGDGPDLPKIQSAARGFPNISVVGYQSFDSLKSHMQRAKALVFAAEEDLGLAPIEAQACGTPVIAYGKGGVLDTVIENVTGIFFNHQNIEDLCSAVAKFETMTFDYSFISQHASNFSEESFRNRFLDAINNSTEINNLSSTPLKESE